MCGTLRGCVSFCGKLLSETLAGSICSFSSCACWLINTLSSTRFLQVKLVPSYSTLVTWRSYSNGLSHVLHSVSARVRLWLSWSRYSFLLTKKIFYETGLNSLHELILFIPLQRNCIGMFNSSEIYAHIFRFRTNFFLHSIAPDTFWMFWTAQLTSCNSSNIFSYLLTYLPTYL